jgi:hypothetical protein
MVGKAKDGYQAADDKISVLWSRLTIFSLGSIGSSSHESRRETSIGGTLSHLWREAGGEM